MPFYFLLAPTLLVMVSWNSLPGDVVFPVKLYLEDIAIIFMSPSQTAKGTLSVKYAERRFSEATTLLATKNSVQGFAYLERQVANTSTLIQSSKDGDTKSALAHTYLVSLYVMKEQLEEQKQSLSVPSGESQRRTTPTQTPTPIARSQTGQGVSPTSTPYPTVSPAQPSSLTGTWTPAPTGRVPTHTPTPTIRYTPTSTPTLTPALTVTPTPTPVAVPDEIIVEIQDTQDVIDQAIEEMEDAAQSAAAPQAPAAAAPTTPATQTPEQTGPGRRQGLENPGQGRGSPAREEEQQAETVEVQDSDD